MAACLASGSTGCAMQLGATGGHAVGSRGAEGRPAWTTQAAGSVVVGKERGVLLGSELEGRTELGYGSRWTLGTWLGYSWLPRRERGALGGELHLDLGTPIRDGTIFRYGTHYAGATGSLIIWASERHDEFDADATPWLLVRALEVVTGPRVRCYRDDPAGPVSDTRCDFALSVALRIRMVSDLLE